MLKEKKHKKRKNKEDLSEINHEAFKEIKSIFSQKNIYLYI